jgi:hypothetical protein
MPGEYGTIKKTLKLSSDVQFGTCKECPTALSADLDSNINHYLKEHQYKLLHVGQETMYDTADGKPAQTTIAVIGRE